MKLWMKVAVLCALAKDVRKIAASNWQKCKELDQLASFMEDNFSIEGMDSATV